MKQTHQKFNIKSISQYWKLKLTQEILTREITKRTTELASTEKCWEKASLYKFTHQQRREKAREVRELGFDLARLRGRLMILDKSLANYEYYSNYIIPIDVIKEGE